MLTTINNRYQVVSQLGQGGMGIVYLVKDVLRQDQIMALKLVRADAIGDRGLAQFKYEFAAMAQLRHPNLVEVYDFGTVVNVQTDQSTKTPADQTSQNLLNQYFFTMQHVPGDDLFSLASRQIQSSPQITDYTWLYEILVQVCRALQYLHTRGFVHYDVKPSNIRITTSGVVKLMDFGLVSEGRVSAQLKARGTPDYIAPEIISGGMVDQRADLYSLGVTLYEIVSGRLPFHDTSSVTVLRQHLQAQPELPPELVEHLPAGLQALILKLMAKNPANRYDSADQVILAINDISGLNFPVETRETRRGYIYSASFVGRDYEIAHLQGLLMRTMQGQGRMVLIDGAPGMGKMRLARELKTNAQMQRALVLEGACQAQVRSPYRVWTPIFSQMILHSQAIQSPSLQKYGPAIARLIPELTGRLNLEGKLLIPSSDPNALLQSAAQFLLDCDQALVVILEDLQYADAESLELLAYLGEAAASNHILICGVFREDEISPEHPLQQILNRSYRIRRQNEAQATSDHPASQDQPYELLILEPLTNEAVSAYVRSMLGLSSDVPLPEGLLERLMAETGGNPSFIQAVMQSLFDEELLHFDGAQWIIDVTNLRLPASIQEAALRQLDRLDQPSRDLLQWAAVLGQWLEVDVLIEVCGMPPDQAMGLINQAAWHHVLSSREQADRQIYRFSTDAMRDVLYYMLAPAERARRHQHVLQVLRKLYDETEIAEWLAWHSEQAGELADALRYITAAAEKASRLHAHDLAIQHYSHALDLIQQHPELETAFEKSALSIQYDLLSGRATCYGIQGNLVSQAADLQVLENLARQMGDIPRRIDILIRQSRLTANLGDSLQALQTSQEAVNQAHQINDARLEADSLAALGNSFFLLGHYEESLSCYQQSLTLHEKIGDRRGEVNSLRLVGRALSRLGRSAEATQYNERSLALSREIGDERGEAQALVSLGIRSTDQARGRDYYEQALAIYRRIGDRHGQATCYNNLALIYWSLGLYNRAREYMQQAMEIAHSQQNRSSLVHYYETLGRILFDLNEYEEAEKCLQEGMHLSTEIGDRWSGTLYYLMLSRVALARQQLDLALELSRTAADRLVGENVPEAGTVLAWQGAILLERGDWQAAYAQTSHAIEFADRFHSGGDYPLQDIYWQRYRVLRCAPELASNAPLDEASWLCLQQARDAMFERIVSVSDEGLRRNYLNKVRINHDILVEWTRQSARRSGIQAVETPVQPETETGVPADTAAAHMQEKFKRVLDISIQMNETHDAEALLNYVMDQVIELSGAERGFLVLVDETGRSESHLDFRVARGMAQEEFERLKTMNANLGSQVSFSVLGEVTRSKKPILLQDAMTDERFGRQSSVLELNLRSVLCVPLLTRSELVGMIYADNRSLSGRFSQADVDMMMIFANQAATAIENARMYQELQAWTRSLEERVAERTRQVEQANQALSRRALQLEASSRVAQQATSILILQDLLDQVVMLLQQRFGYYFVGIWLIEQDRRTIRLYAGASKRTSHFDSSMLSQNVPTIHIDARSIVAGVCRTGAHRMVEDVRQVADYLVSESLPETRAEITLPLRMGNQIYGALDINADQAAAFSTEDVMTLQTLADQVAIAIRNAQLYRSERERRQLAEALSQASREITSSLDMEEVPGRILDQLAAVVPYERCSILMQEGKMLHAVARRGFPDDDHDMNVPIRPGDVYEQVVAQSSPIIIDDVTNDAGWKQVEGLPLNKSWMGVPLMTKGRVMGMVSLTRPDAGAFLPADATIASAFAMQAAVALENASLYQQITRFNEQLEHWVEQRTDELNRAYHVLERLDKTKSSFIEVAAHELRTPLTVIKGYTQVVRSRPGVQQDETAIEMVNGILTGADRLHEIVNSMLDVSKISSQTLNVHKERISLAELARATALKYEKALRERKLNLTVQEMDTLPWVEADLDLMGKVFNHLIVNAIKYTPDGGKITVSGRLVDDRSGEINPPNPNAVEIIISDTGIGIDPANHKVIFEKFFSTGQVMVHSSGQTKFKGGGPGLGLAIVHGIVEAHGGRTWVESPGYDEATCPGSKFYVRLPLS